MALTVYFQRRAKDNTAYLAEIVEPNLAGIDPFLGQALGPRVQHPHAVMIDLGHFGARIFMSWLAISTPGY